MRWLNLAEVLELHSNLIQQSSCEEPGCCLTIESLVLMVNPQPPYYVREITECEL